jgi:hypothetical protein
VIGLFVVVPVLVGTSDSGPKSRPAATTSDAPAASNSSTTPVSVHAVPAPAAPEALPVAEAEPVATAVAEPVVEPVAAPIRPPAPEAPQPMVEPAPIRLRRCTRSRRHSVRSSADCRKGANYQVQTDGWLGG